MSVVDPLDQRLARSHRSVLAGLRRRLALAEERLAEKEADARTHHTALKRQQLHVAELRRAVARMRDVVDQSG